MAMLIDREMHDQAHYCSEVREANAPMFIAPISTKSNVFLNNEGMLCFFASGKEASCRCLSVYVKSSCFRGAAPICKWRSKNRCYAMWPRTCIRVCRGPCNAVEDNNAERRREEEENKCNDCPSTQIRAHHSQL